MIIQFFRLPNITFIEKKISGYKSRIAAALIIGFGRLWPYSWQMVFFGVCFTVHRLLAGI